MKKLIPILAYTASVAISRKYCTEPWIVGPVFATALLVANYEAVRKKISPGHLLFVATSTLIYALVFWISDKGWKFQQDWLDMLAGSLSGAVVVGSLLMPFVQSILLGLDLKAAQSGALTLIGAWYGVVLLSLLDEVTGFKPNIDYILISMALWQGLYIYRLKLK